MSVNLDRFKVLVVDDVSSARKTIVLILREMGILNVVESRSSLDALDKINKETFSLVISDWEMPDLDGLQLLTQVKKIPKCKDLPFIMITAASEKTKVIQALKCGVTDYATKPICLKVLSEKIARAFQ